MHTGITHLFATTETNSATIGGGLSVDVLAAAIAVISALISIYTLFLARRDRSADVILKLEELFDHPDVIKGRDILEENHLYHGTKDALEWYVKNPSASNSAAQQNLSAAQIDAVAHIDKLLRFYVVLRGVFEAKQANNDSLRLCYAYWLNYYLEPNRAEFRHYVEEYFGTLHAWIKRDRGNENFFGYKFFRGN